MVRRDDGLNLKMMIKAIKRGDQIVTPRLQSWLVQHGDDPLSPHVAARIRELLETKPRERHASFSASSAGMCLRSQVLGYLGAAQAPIDHQLANVFNDGKWRHLRWQAMLLMAGILTDVYDIEDPQLWPAMRARGTMDGVGVVVDDHARRDWRGKEYGFELKGVSAFQYAKYVEAGPKEEDHLQQVGRYFLHTGYELFVIVYENKSTQEWTEWVKEANDPKMQQIIEDQRMELVLLNQYVEDKIIPDCECGRSSSLCALYPNAVWPEGDRYVA